MGGREENKLCEFASIQLQADANNGYACAILIGICFSLSVLIIIALYLLPSGFFPPLFSLG